MRNLLILIAMMSQAAWASPEAICDPKAVGDVIANAFNARWNEGTVRAWDQQGEMWSMPLPGTIQELSTALKKGIPPGRCDLTIADEGSWTARVKFKTEPPAKSLDSSFISSNGTTLGVFSPGPDEMIVMMYPARIAAATARGQGPLVGNRFQELVASISPELDIEYNFGTVQINMLGAKSTSGMRAVSDEIFKLLRSRGYVPLAKSQSAVALFDGLLPPDEHESFWTNADGIIRVELAKQKRGQVKVNLHETRNRK